MKQPRKSPPSPPLASSIVWLEQPCHPDIWTGRYSAPFPILADESAESTPELAISAYDGIVLKPAVLGLCKSLALARRAFMENRLVVAGCLLQSSLTTALSLHLSGFYTSSLVDLDTVFLLENDPFTGVHRTNHNRLSLHPGAGLGVDPRIELPWQAGGTVRWRQSLLDRALSY